MADKDGRAAELAALKQQIIAATDIKAFYESHIPNSNIQFKADGWSQHLHCPIHNDTGKPNLQVNLHSGGFHCFACGKSGSIFDFLSFISGVDPKTGFQEALVTLANKAGINIRQFSQDVKSGKFPLETPPDATKTTAPKFIPKINKAASTDSTTPPIPKSRADKCHKDLRPEHFKYLTLVRGLTEETINYWNLGWDSNRRYKDTEGAWKKGRFTIPIPGRDKLLRNIRAYAADAQSDQKMVNTKGYGSPPRLLNLHNLIEKNWTNVIICEGEFDLMLLDQHIRDAGLDEVWGVVTGTHGCSTFEEEWIPDLHGKNIIFLFDVDAHGKRWAQSHATTKLLPALSSGNIPSIKIATLPLDGTLDNKDVTDYFVKAGGKLNDLLSIIENTPPLIIGGRNHDEATLEPIEVSSFVACIKDRRYIDERVRVPITISGQSTKIYHATRSLRVTGCPLRKGDGNDECCTLNTGIQTIPYGDTLFIESCMTPKSRLQTILQDVACTKHKPCTIEEVEKVVMEEYFGHQVIKRLTATADEKGRMINSQELVTTSVYILQPEKNVEIGPHDYLATGIVRSHPQSRQATLFVEHLEPMEEDWQKYELDERNIGYLKELQGFQNVKQLLNEFTSGVTQIYESDEILLTVLLTYLSPRWINFNGQVIHGWLNACVLGDSGTGKSATYIRISDWLELGDLFSALSGSRTGLLYSLKQKGVEWYVQVGRYVMASGKIIAVDETQETPAEEIKKMAKAMDEGWLDVSHVASGGWQTQTRTLFLMNPKPPKKISDFPYGCMAIGECFDPMFIRRLDIAVFSTMKEDIEFYNKKYDKELVKSVSITPEMFRSVVYWAWTRSVNDVKWTEEATQVCLDKAIELGKIFGHADDIPLVFPGDFRNNLARLSTAFAVLSGSFTEDYTGIIVNPIHVEKMAMFVDACYSSANCNLRQYSKNSSRKKTLKDFDQITETFNKVVELAKHSSQRGNNQQPFLQMVLLLHNQGYVRHRDLAEQIGVTLNWVRKHIAILQMFDLIELNRGGYKTTRKFNLFLQKWQEDKEVEEMLDKVHEQIGKIALQQEAQDDYGHDPFFDSHYGN